MSHQTSHPLAWSQTGDPIELPATAVLWRVRRLTGSVKGGAPEMVYGADGLPLMVDIGATPDEFAEAVERKAGKYRLDALDDARKPVAGVPAAYVTVPGAAARIEAMNGEPHEIAVRTLADALARQSDALIKQSAQIASIADACARVIAAVDAAGLPRPVAPPPPAPSDDPDKRRNARRDDDDDDEDEDEDSADDEQSMLDKAADFIHKAGPAGVMAMCQGVPVMVGGVIKEVRNAVAQATGGGDGGGGES